MIFFTSFFRSSRTQGFVDGCKMNANRERTKISRPLFISLCNVIFPRSYLVDVLLTSSNSVIYYTLAYILSHRQKCDAVTNELWITRDRVSYSKKMCVTPTSLLFYALKCVKHAWFVTIALCSTECTKSRAKVVHETCRELEWEIKKKSEIKIKASSLSVTRVRPSLHFPKAFLLIVSTRVYRVGVKIWNDEM